VVVNGGVSLEKGQRGASSGGGLRV
jgi:hypothetical protein